MSRHFLGFGNGSAGIIPSSGIYSGANTSCSGSASSTTLTVSSTSGFSANDYVLIDQSRGTGAGNWELNQIASVSSSLTMRFALENTYTDSGASQAQVIKILQYKGGTISGTFTGNAWNGNVGGILPIMCSGRLAISSYLTATGLGFRGGNGVATGVDNSKSYQGESAIGVGSLDQLRNGAGGGGGYKKSGALNPSGANGGGHGTVGLEGQTTSADTTGQAGTTDGGITLIDFVFGGGGGGAIVNTSGYTAGKGGNGGGKIFVFAEQLVVTGYITNYGSAGSSSTTGDRVGTSGGGAGGGILIKSNYANIGTDRLRVTGGTYGSASGYISGGRNLGGAGGKGRIRVECCSLAGSVSSAYYGSYSALTTGLDWCYSAGAIL